MALKLVGWDFFHAQHLSLLWTTTSYNYESSAQKRVKENNSTVITNKITPKIN